MSFQASATGRRFAIDGEISHALRAARQQTMTPAETQSLAVQVQAIQALLTQAPNDGDVLIVLAGERDTNGWGYVRLELAFGPHLDRRDATAQGVQAAALAEIVAAVTRADESALGVPTAQDAFVTGASVLASSDSGGGGDGDT